MQEVWHHRLLRLNSSYGGVITIPHPNTDTHVCMHTRTCAHTHTRTHTHTVEHMHAHERTHTHEHTHTHTHIDLLQGRLETVGSVRSKRQKSCRAVTRRKAKFEHVTQRKGYCSMQRGRWKNRLLQLWMPTAGLQILLTGKSINFLRQVCQDRTPTRGRDLAMNMDMKHGESFSPLVHL